MSLDRLISESQAGELYDAISISTSIFGVNIGHDYVWDLGELAVPSVVANRCGIPPENIENYLGIAMVPIAESQAILPVTLNFLLAGERSAPPDHIKYRAAKDLAGNVTLEKHLLGEPEGLRDIDSANAFDLFQNTIMDAPVPEDLHEATSLLDGTISQLDSYFKAHEQAEQFAGQLGLTQVFADEAEALLDLITSVRGQES